MMMLLVSVVISLILSSLSLTNRYSNKFKRQICNNFIGLFSNSNSDGDNDNGNKSKGFSRKVNNSLQSNMPR